MIYGMHKVWGRVADKAQSEAECFISNKAHAHTECKRECTENPKIANDSDMKDQLRGTNEE